MYLYLHMYLDIYEYIHLCICVCMYILIHDSMYVSRNMSVFIYVCMYCVYTHTQAHKSSLMQAHTYIYMSQR